MLESKVKIELINSRKLLTNAKCWPKNLKGACNVSSILVYFILKKNNLKPILINNHKHCFNMINIHGFDYVVDLTATQINKSFSELEICKIEDIKNRALETKIGKEFYSTERLKKNYFFKKGTLIQVLKCERRNAFDYVSVFNILKKVVKILDMDIKLDIDLNFDSVDNLSKLVVKELYKREAI